MVSLAIDRDIGSEYGRGYLGVLSTQGLGTFPEAERNMKFQYVASKAGLVRVQILRGWKMFIYQVYISWTKL